MKNIEDELKALRDSENKPPPTLADLENIAKKISNPDYCKDIKVKSFVTRLLPECYSAFTFNNLDVKNFHEETLFFIFYALPESELQVKAYNELIIKGFAFSKTLNAFVFFADPKIADNKKRSILVFDPFLWEKVYRETVFDEKFISTLEHLVECKYDEEP
ncbi:uncharacterized protein VICG_01338 [Vittaforma corneae ATCC 50505]|uniref:NOT2/NOT3/NOT5 C-terminal domain-containing protein n=1 Tax=Vittaforma corneae (strain ATCC 50505) TaxID=993615 RepID=L2GM90_VITCO|nr:uncharacterized protein VICG_01338 [Vittaforma corneae ATCC 50505]ELA41590.1 hypothetical protein VICG_01338 [Vittaforma corneae ATCC 50505]